MTTTFPEPEPDGGYPLRPQPAPVVVEPQDRGASESGHEAVGSPAKLLRIGAMAKELLEEVRRASLDDAGRARLRDLYERSLSELSDTVSAELRDELSRLSLPFEEGTPSEGELRVAQAQLVGWFEGLFHGIQAALFSQQMAARAQLEDSRRQALPAGPLDASLRPGTYL